MNKSQSFLFSSSRLNFRFFTIEDLPIYHQLTGDLRVMKLIIGKSLTEEQSKERLLEAIEKDHGHPGLGRFCCCHKDGTFIGLGKLEPYEDWGLEVGYALIHSQWGKGFGQEICQSLVEYGRKLKIKNTLVGIIDPENEGSRKILINCGFKYDCSVLYKEKPTDRFLLTF